MCSASCLPPYPKMNRCMTSLAPSTMRLIRESRKIRSTSFSVMYPSPPMIWTASLTTSQPISEQNILQIAVSTMMSSSPRSRKPVVAYSTASIA